MNTPQYLDALRRRFNAPSDYELHRTLDVTPGAVKHYRRGRAHFADYIALRVALLLDVPAVKVLADMHAQRAQDGIVRAAWRAIAEAA